MKKLGIILLTAGMLLGCVSCGEKKDSDTYEIIEENIVVGEGTDYPLNGILTLPDMPEGSNDKIPAVVLVHGSGTHDMDETIYAYKPFMDIANYLAAQGIAVVRYDKRAYIYASRLAENLGDYTVKDEAIDDAILAANLLKNDSRIDSDKVYIIGHSLGGMIAPRIDAEGGNFAGIIILAGSPRTLEEITRDQLNAQVAALPTDQKELGRQQVDELLSIFDSFKTMSDEELKQSFFSGASGYYFKDLDSHPASDYLLKLTKPVLIMQGGKDFQVYPDVDYVQYQELLKDKNNVTFKLYPTLNHCFVTSATGTADEYKVKGTVNKEALNDISEWIKAN